jgi:hypothetical protein
LLENLQLTTPLKKEGTFSSEQEEYRPAGQKVETSSPLFVDFAAKKGTLLFENFFRTSSERRALHVTDMPSQRFLCRTNGDPKLAMVPWRKA